MSRVSSASQRSTFTSAVPMRICFAMALCMWRDDWPPDANAVRFGIFETHNELIDFTSPFRCTHPPEGPEELECCTELNITYAACTRYRSQLHEVSTVEIQATNAKSFLLCRLDLHCGARRPAQLRVREQQLDRPHP